MTPLAQLVAASRAILFDFDGPVCRLFARYPAATLAGRLRDELARHGVELSESLAGGRDPLAVLRWVGEHRPDLVETAEQLVVAAELEAVRTAEPTPGAHDAIRAAAKSGRPVAIVSNNSQPAIEAYLATYQLTDAVNLVVGRAHPEPTRMKRPPHRLRQDLRPPIRARRGRGRLSSPGHGRTCPIPGHRVT